MLILIPVILLIFFTILIQIIGRGKLNTGSIWLLTSALIFIVWISLIILRVVMPQGMSIENWNPLQISTDTLHFEFNSQTWILSFLLLSVLLAVIFTDTTRLAVSNSLMSWSGSMILIAVGLLAIFSQTILSIMLAWTFIDLVEFCLLSVILADNKIHKSAVIEFSFRIIGSLFILAAYVLSRSNAENISAISLTQNSLNLLLVGAALRLGVLPLHLPLTGSLPVRRSLGTILCLVSPLSVVAFLSQVTTIESHGFISILVYLFSFLAALYGAIKWFASKDELLGRPYWMLSLSGMMLILFLRGQIDSLIAVTMIMVICGAVVFLHVFESRLNFIFGVVLIVGMLGFPFTPVNEMWNGLLSRPFSAFNVIFYISLCFLLGGLLKHLLRPCPLEHHIEKWMEFFYFLGIGILVIVPWITLFWDFAQVQSLSFWAAPVFCLVVLSAGYGINSFNLLKELTYNRVIQMNIHLAGRVGRVIDSLLNFNWLFAFLNSVYNFSSWLVGFVLNILEGDGGLLWGLVFLVLLASVIIR